MRQFHARQQAHGQPGIGQARPGLLRFLLSLPDVMALSLIVSGLTLFSIALIWRQVQISRPSSQTKSVAIVVLGDIGRSPRMTYHAQSFADAKFMTYIVGYRGILLIYVPCGSTLH